jgi:LysM repeat protein
MPDQRRRRFRLSHLLAPLALIAVAAAVAVVVLNSTAIGGDDDDPEITTTQQTETERVRTTPSGRRLRRNYRVRPGDSFGSIAERTGVSVARLEELNPEVDPQALVVGQRIRLRE